MNATQTTYAVVKVLPNRPGPGLKTSIPSEEVTMSRHKTMDAAKKAMRKYERDHRGYAEFRIEEQSE